MQIAGDVLSGVLTSAVIALGAYFYPVILRVVGRGVRDISGSWTYYQRSNSQGRTRPSGEVTVRQWGTHVRMNFSISRRLNGSQYPDSEAHHFRVRARWRNDELIGTFTEIRARHRRGTLVLHWRSDILVGKSVYVENNPSQASAQTEESNWVTVHDVKLSRRSGGLRRPR